MATTNMDKHLIENMIINSLKAINQYFAKNPPPPGITALPAGTAAPPNFAYTNSLAMNAAANSAISKLIPGYNPPVQPGQQPGGPDNGQGGPGNGQGGPGNGQGGPGNGATQALPGSVASKLKDAFGTLSQSTRDNFKKMVDIFLTSGKPSPADEYIITALIYPSLIDPTKIGKLRINEQAIMTISESLESVDEYLYALKLLSQDNLQQKINNPFVNKILVSKKNIK